MATQEEAAAELVAINAQLTKVQAEVAAASDALNAKIAELTAALDQVTPEVQAALDGVKAAAQSLDDINPDAPTV